VGVEYDSKTSRQLSSPSMPDYTILLFKRIDLDEYGTWFSLNPLKYLLLLLEQMKCGKTGVILAHRFQGNLFQEKKSVLMSHFPRQAVSSMLHSP